MNNTFLVSDKIVLIISIIVTAIFLYLLKYKIADKTKGKFAFATYCNFMINLYALYYLQNFFLFEHLIIVNFIIFGVATNIILRILGLYNEKYDNLFAFYIIFVVQLGYIFYSPYYLRQHDGRSFVYYENGGHLGYIGYIFFNNSLPKGSPIDFWCFSNPPLFHIVSAIFLKIQTTFFIDIDLAFENLQFLSWVYEAIFLIFVYKILKEMNVKKSIAYLIAFIGLSPAIIIMSGSLNNDMLSIMLSTIAIYYTIRWYREDSLKNLIKIALAISFAMMTKISAALVAIPIAFVFLIKLIQNKNEIKKYIINFSIFALIALPIGLWFPIKNLVLYDIPITYIQSVDESNDSNISRFSVFDRVFKISKENLETINVVMGGEKIDYNLFLTTLKSYIVDETIEYENNFRMTASINTVFICAIIISILFIVNIIYMIKNYKKINNHWLIFFGGLFLLTVIYFIKFCFDYPFTFTMNFRYIVPTLITYSVFTGTVCENNKKLFYINIIPISIFCIASIILFMGI